MPKKSRYIGVKNDAKIFKSKEKKYEKRKYPVSPKNILLF